MGRLLNATCTLCLAGLLLGAGIATAQDTDCQRADREMEKLDRTLRDALVAGSPDERQSFLEAAKGIAHRLGQMPPCIVPADPIAITHRHGEIARIKFDAISALIAALPRGDARPTIRQLARMGTALEQLADFLSAGSGDIAAMEAMRDELIGRIHAFRKPDALAPVGSLRLEERLIAQEIASDENGILFLQFVLDPHAKRAGWRPVKAKSVGVNWRPDGYSMGIDAAVLDPAGFVEKHRDILNGWLRRRVALRLGRSNKTMWETGSRDLTGASLCQGIRLQETGKKPILRLYDLERSTRIAQWSLEGPWPGPEFEGLVQRILGFAPATRNPKPSPEKNFARRLSLPLAPFLEISQRDAHRLRRLPEEGNIGFVLRYRDRNCGKPGSPVSLPHCSAIQLECSTRGDMNAYLVSEGRRIPKARSWNTTDWYTNRRAFEQAIEAILFGGQSHTPDRN